MNPIRTVCRIHTVRQITGLTPSMPQGSILSGRMMIGNRIPPTVPIWQAHTTRSSGPAKSLAYAAWATPSRCGDVCHRSSHWARYSGTAASRKRKVSWSVFMTCRLRCSHTPMAVSREQGRHPDRFGVSCGYP